MLYKLNVFSVCFAACLLCQPSPMPDLGASGTLLSRSVALACREMAQQISQNLRFLLFRKAIPRENWLKWVQKNTSIPAGRLNALVSKRLDDSEIGEAELQQLAKALGLPEDAEELRFSDLVSDSQLKVLAENLRYLLDECPRGGKKQLAETLQVTPTTVSRWLGESTGISSRQLSKLNQYFVLPADVDLRLYPLFLDVEPAAVSQRRKWVLDHLQALTDDEFQSLYPALKRLLEDR